MEVLTTVFSRLQDPIVSCAAVCKRCRAKVGGASFNLVCVLYYLSPCTVLTDAFFLLCRLITIRTRFLLSRDVFSGDVLFRL